MVVLAVNKVSASCGAACRAWEPSPGVSGARVTAGAGVVVAIAGSWLGWWVPGSGCGGLA